MSRNPKEEELDIQRIVLATDLAEASSRASSIAESLAKRDGAELLVIHVVHVPLPPVTEPRAGAAGLHVKLEEDARTHAETVVSGIVERAGSEGVRATPAVLSGVVDEQIVQFAEDENANLIVVGTHGRTGVSKFFLGSVAAQVIANAPCPVLAVRSA